MDVDLESQRSFDSNDPREEDDYERERKENIKQNAQLLESLGLSALPSIRTNPIKKPKLTAGEQRVKKETRAREAAMKRERLEPTRRSSRVAGKAAVISNAPLPDDSPPPKRQPYLPRGVAITIPSGPEYDSPGPSTRAPRPTREADGRLVFEGRWHGVFTPNLTPEEMFSGGAFAGAFFCDTYSNILKAPLPSKTDISSLPFTVADSGTLLSNPEPSGEYNRFLVRAGQSLQEWEKAGWIWKGDPRGWAQWYVRFWEGRRCEDDERQVRRWLKVAGPTGRFKRALLKKVQMSGGESALGDEDVGRVLRQCLWQWGYVLNEAEYIRAMREE